MMLQVLLFFFGFGHFQAPAEGDDRSITSLADSLTVYVFLHDDCLISQFYTLELTRLYETYHTKKVGFVGYFPNATSTAEQMATFGPDYKLTFPLLPDYDKVMTLKFG